MDRDEMSSSSCTSWMSWRLHDMSCLDAEVRMFVEAVEARVSGFAITAIRKSYRVAQLANRSVAMPRMILRWR